MINPFDDINWHPDNAELRSFGRTMLLAFSALSAFLLAVNLFRFPLNESLTIPSAFFLVGVFFCLVSMLGVPVALPFYWGWNFFAGIIGLVLGNLMLLLFFYVFFSGFAVLFRVGTGRDPLALTKDPNARTWWRERVAKRNLKSYFKQY